MSARRFRSFLAFTLIELLVVIALIAILAGLLMPVLFAARGRAQTVICQSNLKQFSYAGLMYAMDYDDWVPTNAPYWPTDGVLPESLWVKGWLDNDSSTNWTDNTNTLYLKNSLLAPYLGESVGVWKCPTDRSMSTIYGQRLPRVRSYSMNDYLSTPTRGNASSWKIIRKTTDIVRLSPSEIFVIIDERQTPSTTACLLSI